MISTHWLEKRKPYWSRLEQLLEQSQRGGLKSLARTDLRELSLLYRQTAADLAAIREDKSSLHFARYLNQLLARAHNTIYAGGKSSPLGILSFFGTSYPRIFRRNLRFTLAAVVLFIVGSVVGALLTVQDPDFQMQVLGPQMVETIEHHQMWTHSIVSIKPLASSHIMTNNLSVSFMTFAMGITAGVGTIYMLIFNGLLMGVIGVACAFSGMSLSLWSFVAPHGVLELPAIFIAGGAGLRIAHGLLFPGTLPRKQSLSIAGSEATRLLVGCIPMLIVAGVIEGFVSPTGLAIPMKFLVAAALFVLLLGYLFMRGQEPAASADKVPADRILPI
jgi:uncharacterized membrane protein SpoIIM required for sporulation